jgi:hypothetical protein
MTNYLTAKLLQALLWLTRNQQPYVIDTDYLVRYYIIPKNRIFNIYLHYFTGSDAPTPHDHPWWSLGLILKGRYIEHTAKGSFVRKTGALSLRTPSTIHWIEIDQPIYTLFITGPNRHQWGFFCEDGNYYQHEDYMRRRGPDRLASGCGESD